MGENNLTALSKVHLRDPDRFPDIGTRHGTVLRVDAGVVVKWRGLEGETTLLAEELEMVERANPLTPEPAACQTHE
jgi:hypothetical protein